MVNANEKPELHDLPHLSNIYPLGVTLGDRKVGQVSGNCTFTATLKKLSLNFLLWH